MFQTFFPDEYLDSAYVIDYEKLYSQGYRGLIFDIDNTCAEEISDQFVQTNNGVWSLSMCCNIGIIGVPGTYRLELNDTTAIGVAQVYAELIQVNKLPVQIKDLFFL